MRLGSIRCIAMGLLVGCYSPTFPENQPCSETQRCPEGLACDIAANECVAQVPETARFVKLSTYDDNVCGIDPLGALYCWGHNARAELGLGDTDPRSVPTRVGVESDWLDVHTGKHLTCGLRAGDQLWCWGDDLAANTGILNPRQVAGAYTTLTVGDDTWCAIEAAGLVCQTRGAEPILQVLPAGVAPVQITATHGTVCVIDDAERLWCWGNNNAAQLGTGDNTSLTPDLAHQITGAWKAVELGDSATCAIATTGTLSCWGQCGEGQLGRNTECGIPGVVDDERTFASVSVGRNQTCAIDVAGTLSCMGTNESGELGAKGGLPSSELLDVEHGEWTHVATGNRITCGLRADHEAWCWGNNELGELGDGGGGTELAPVAVDPGPFDKVFAGRANGCALREGTLWCWGANGFGQLGDGTTIERRRPVQIGTDNDWRTISITRTHACGIRENGTLWCWGNNSQKQLGIGGNLDVSVPTQVGTSTGWTEVAVAQDNVCGILDGFVHCWGRLRTSMPERELEQPVSSLSASGSTFTVIDSTTGGTLSFGPFQAPTPEELQAWTSVDRGVDHACGLIGSELWCYGVNIYGQLGRTSDFNNNPAAREASNGDWLTFSAGNRTTCAIATDHTLACWGVPELTGLGKEGVVVDFPTPVGTALWNEISVGDYTTCGLQMDGSLHCWGYGVASGRGDGKGGHERPTRVSPP